MDSTCRHPKLGLVARWPPPAFRQPGAHPDPEASHGERQVLVVRGAHAGGPPQQQAAGEDVREGHKDDDERRRHGARLLREADGQDQYGRARETQLPPPLLARNELTRWDCLPQRHKEWEGWHCEAQEQEILRAAPHTCSVLMLFSPSPPLTCRRSIMSE